MKQFSLLSIYKNSWQKSYFFCAKMTNKISNLFICQRLKTINQSASEREEFLEVSKSIQEILKIFITQKYLNRLSLCGRGAGDGETDSGETGNILCVGCGWGWTSHEKIETVHYFYADN